MRLFIPELGTKLVLREDWRFALHFERRNEKFGNKAGIVPPPNPHRHWHDWYQADKCALTGFDLSMRTVKGKGPNAESASLDRIDNDKGYTLDNVQWLHKDINWMKGRFDQQRFITLCRAVAEGSGSDLCA